MKSHDRRYHPEAFVCTPGTGGHSGSLAKLPPGAALILLTRPNKKIREVGGALVVIAMCGYQLETLLSSLRTSIRNRGLLPLPSCAFQEGLQGILMPNCPARDAVGWRRDKMEFEVLPQQMR